MAVAKLLRSDKSFRELIMELGSIDKCSCELVFEETVIVTLGEVSQIEMKSAR